MTVRIRFGPVVGAVMSIAAVTLLAGCEGGGAETQPSGIAAGMSLAARPIASHSVARGGSQATPASLPGSGFMTREVDAKGGASIFVSDQQTGVVSIYNFAGKKTGQLAGFSQPQGLTTDAQENLYLANTGSNEILEYAKGYKGKPKTLLDPGQYPVDVAVDGNGNLGMTNIVSTSGGPGSVSFYRKGATMPTRTVSGAPFARAYFDAFDAEGNLFIDGTDASGNVLVGEIAGGIKGKSIVVLTTANRLQFPGGVQVTTKDEIAICDQAGLAIYTYGRPHGGSLGKPLVTTPLGGASDPVSLAFDAKNNGAYVVDVGTAKADQFPYPAGGSPVRSIGFSNGSPIVIALNPTEIP